MRLSLERAVARDASAQHRQNRIVAASAGHVVSRQFGSMARKAVDPATSVQVSSRGGEELGFELDVHAGQGCGHLGVRMFTDDCSPTENGHPRRQHKSDSPPSALRKAPTGTRRFGGSDYAHAGGGQQIEARPMRRCAADVLTRQNNARSPDGSADVGDTGKLTANPTTAAVASSVSISSGIG